MESKTAEKNIVALIRTFFLIKNSEKISLEEPGVDSQVET